MNKKKIHNNNHPSRIVESWNWVLYIQILLKFQKAHLTFSRNKPKTFNLNRVISILHISKKQLKNVFLIKLQTHLDIIKRFGCDELVICLFQIEFKSGAEFGFSFNIDFVHCSLLISFRHSTVFGFVVALVDKESQPKITNCSRNRCKNHYLLN